MSSSMPNTSQACLYPQDGSLGVLLDEHTGGSVSFRDKKAWSGIHGGFDVIDVAGFRVLVYAEPAPFVGCDVTKENAKCPGRGDARFTPDAAHVRDGFGNSYTVTCTPLK